MEHEDPCQWWEQQGRQQWLEMIERMEKEESKHDDKQDCPSAS